MITTYTTIRIDALREILAVDEPVEEIRFTIGDQVRFDFRVGWQLGIGTAAPTDPIDAYVTIGGGNDKRTLQMTKEAMLELTSFCGIGHRYACKLPAQLLTPQMNYWYREGLMEENAWDVRDFKILVSRGLAAAFTRASVVPFSNLRILDEVLAGLIEHYGLTPVRVDRDYLQSLRSTRFAVMLPEQIVDLSGDRWVPGIMVKNGLTGYERTSLDGVLFQLDADTGVIDARNPAAGVWARKRGGADAVYDWASQATQDIVANLADTFTKIDALREVSIKGHISDALRDVFTHYRIPVRDRGTIIARMENAESLTMYAVLTALAEAARDTSLDVRHRENLMRLAGDLPHAASSRCESCRRLAHVH